jgi:Protein of unknown function (DUF2812)
MKVYKVFVNVLKEERWLNEMLMQGYTCTRAKWFGSYTFEKTSSKKVMRLDYRDHMDKEKYEEYIAMHEEFGWEHVNGSRFGGRHYWQKEEDGYDEMFSDQTSQLAFYKRLSDWALLFAMILFIVNINQIGGNLLNPKALYLTPGLWDKEGEAFWRAFLFETPVAMFRMVLPLIFAAVFFYAHVQYRKKQRMNVG